jgi:hypothetical protein
MGEITNTDREWFHRNSHTNFRVRKPVDGELEDVFSRAYSGILPRGSIPPLGDGAEWRLLVLNVDLDLLARIPIVQRIGSPYGAQGDGEGTGCLMVSIGGNIAIDKIEGEHVCRL